MAFKAIFLFKPGASLMKKSKTKHKEPKLGQMVERFADYLDTGLHQFGYCFEAFGPHLIQHEKHEGPSDRIPLIIMTHQTTVGAADRALEEIHQLVTGNGVTWHHFPQLM